MDTKLNDIDVVNKDDIGSIKMHEGVISTIIRNATSSVDGVVEFASGKFTDSLANILGSKRNNDCSIRTDIEDNQVTAEITLELEYGKDIKKVVKEIQKTVIESVKSMTGLEVKFINIVVKAITDKKIEKLEEIKGENNE